MECGFEHLDGGGRGGEDGEGDWEKRRRKGMTGWWEGRRETERERE